MSCKALGWIQTKFDEFQLRIDHRIKSGAPSWIHTTFSPFSIKTQSNTEL